MVRYVIGKDPYLEHGEPVPNKDSEAFQKLKQKVEVSREGKSSSTGYPPVTLSRDKPSPLTPGKHPFPSFQEGLQCMKIDIPKGSYIKPKNYLIS